MHQDITILIGGAAGQGIQTYETVKKAFFLSEKYQVSSIVLIDQFLVDSA